MRALSSGSFFLRRLAAAWLAAAAMLALSTAAAQSTPSPADPAAVSRALERAAEAVVGLRTTAVEDARTTSTLGSTRQGSGVVIGSDDLILTIGYLLLEVEQVEVITDDSRRIPARVIAYDVATGFGLVQALAPLKLAPVPLGSAAPLATGEALMMVSGGEEGAVSVAHLVSRRNFSGFWEYHIDGAVFTAPPRSDHSGAALFNARGELVGVGSLVMADVAGPDMPRVPGNMFVPVDLLKPVLAELRRKGRSSQSERAWIGINCVETDGGVVIARISEDSPADVAGLQRGDRIVKIDGTAVDGLERLWKTLWSRPAAEREVTLDILRDGKPETLKVFSIDREKTLRRPRGI